MSKRLKHTRSLLQRVQQQLSSLCQQTCQHTNKWERYIHPSIELLEGVSLRDDIQRKGHVTDPSPKCRLGEDPSRHGENMQSSHRQAPREP